MNIFIVYWHPEPLSFNGALFAKARETFIGEGHETKTSNLFEMGFDPVSSRKNFSTIKDPHYFKQQIEELHATESEGFSTEIEAELRKIEWCDLMIWQFPLWWFGLPAAMKGWVDRVFVMGRTYGNGHFYQTGIFSGKKAMLSLTTGGPEEAYLPEGFNGDIKSILRPIQRGILQFVGFSVLKPHIVYGPAHLQEEQRREHLEHYAIRLQRIFDEQPIPVGNY
jgi:NAD(P)H dehydrogenase (quinone)